MKRIIIYGAGHNYELLKQSELIKKIEIVAIADSYKSGEIIDGYRVIDISEINELAYDEIYLLPMCSENIIDELCMKGINKDRIRNSSYINRKIMDELNQYRYIFITDDTEFLNYPYVELLDRSDTIFFLPLWQNKDPYSEENMVDNTEHVFIVRDHCYDRFSNNGIIEYIKCTYLKSHLIVVMSDMCEGEFGRFATRGSNYIKRLKQDFDVIVTYHFGDAIKYGLTYLEQTYPTVKLNNSEAYDVLFVGKAKNRLPLLYDTYNYLSEKGLTCRFWIDEVSEDDLRVLPGVVYNKRMSYARYLEEVGRCRCILEICQISNESTYRYDEAVIFNKFFLFNDPSVLGRKYYNPKYMFYFVNPNDICIDEINMSARVDYKYSGDYSPDNFLTFLERKLFELAHSVGQIDN